MKKQKMTFDEAKKYLRKFKNETWVFTQNKKGYGRPNFGSDKKGQWWTGNWVGELQQEYSRIGHWIPDENKLYLGTRSKLDPKTVGFDGKGNLRFKIPMDKVEEIEIDQKSIGKLKGKKVLSGLLRPEITSVQIYTYWPKTAEELKSQKPKKGRANSGSTSRGGNNSEMQNLLAALENPKAPEDLVNQVKREVWCRGSAHKNFKAALVKHWGNKCAVTGMSNRELLVASHIKPWAVSEPKEQISPHNGILLAVPIDKLFDKGFISFNDNGVLIFHKKSHTRYLSDAALRCFGLSREEKPKLVKALHLKQKEFLKYHRSKIFD